MDTPTPSARQFYEALIDVIASGEPRRVGSITLDPRREWPATSDTALWGLALDMAEAERRDAIGRAA